MSSVAVEVVEMAEVFLDKRNIEARLHELEQKYGFPSYAFEHDSGLRQQVSEEDEFDWAAYLEHKWALDEADQQLHRNYLNRLNARRTSKGGSQALLAA